MQNILDPGVSAFGLPQTLCFLSAHLYDLSSCLIGFCMVCRLRFGLRSAHNLLPLTTLSQWCFEPSMVVHPAFNFSSLHLPSLSRSDVPFDFAHEHPSLIVQNHARPTGHQLVLHYSFASTISKSTNGLRFQSCTTVSRYFSDHS